MKDNIKDERAQSARSRAEPELPSVNWQFPDTDQWSITIRKRRDGNRLGWLKKEKSRKADRDQSKLIICLCLQQTFFYLVLKSHQITSIRQWGSKSYPANNQ